jgi:hypothetical protein
MAREIDNRKFRYHIRAKSISLTVLCIQLIQMRFSRILFRLNTPALKTSLNCQLGWNRLANMPSLLPTQHLMGWSGGCRSYMRKHSPGRWKDVGAVLEEYFDGPRIVVYLMERRI